MKPLVYHFINYFITYIKRGKNLQHGDINNKTCKHFYESLRLKSGDWIVYQTMKYIQALNVSKDMEVKGELSKTFDFSQCTVVRAS